MDLSPEATKALAYWGPISRAAADRMTTADLWSAIRDEADRLGLASPGVTVRGVSELRGVAGGIQRVSDQFNALPGHRVMRGTMAAEAPWSPAPGSRRTFPQYQVRFQHTYNHQGEQVTEWRTTMIPANLVRTVDDLRRAVAGDALQLARKYGVEHVDVSGLQPLLG